MRLFRSVFSIRPLEFTFKSMECGQKPHRQGAFTLGFIKKSVCNRQKDGYNLAERALYRPSRAAIPESPISQVDLATRGRPSTQQERESRLRNLNGSAKLEERWQPPANTRRSGSFPGTTTPSLSSAWSAAKSSIQKNFAIWKLKKRLGPNLCNKKNPSRRTAHEASGFQLLPATYFAAAPFAAGVPERRETDHA